MMYQSSGQCLGTVEGFIHSESHFPPTTMIPCTGIPYRSDPTIHSWDLANEPRCDSDTSSSAIGTWCARTAAHVKELDSNHMVTVGMEGFFGNSTPGGWGDTIIDIISGSYTD